MSQSRFRIALTTAGSDEQADQIARALVERQLAACVNIVHGVCSVYRWRGQVTREEEKMLVIKTVAERLGALRAAIRELHSYEVPELIVLPVQDGDPEYLEWVAASVEG